MMKFIKRFLPIPALLVFAGLFLFGVLYSFGVLFRPDLRAPAPQYSPEEIAAVVASRDVSFDSDNPLVLHQDVDYSEGPAASWYPRGESPILAQLVEEGLLPPVAERTGPEPAVMKGVDGIGSYGGTWYRVSNSDEDVRVVGWRIAGSNLLRWSPQGYPLKPHLAKAWEVSDDLSTYTIHLRRGIRWSDGHPFTARDILYWWEHEVLHFKSRPRTMLVQGQLGDVEMIDDYTVRFVFPEPYGTFLENLSRGEIYAPEHYLRQYHPGLGDPELIEQKMAEQGVASPRTSYTQLKQWRNPEHPRMWPWVPREFQRRAPYAFVRNPYYWVVDAEGNQLPYIDRIVNDVRSESMVAVTAAAGEITMQMRFIEQKDYTLYMESRDSGGYEVYHWYQADRSVFAVYPNLNRRIDPARPETKWKHQLLNDRRFRQALSLAINRKDIIKAEYAGLTEPAQMAPGPESPFYHPGLFHAFTEHAPQRAKALLDDIGLTQRDSEGYRTFPDGSRMTFFLHVSEFTGVGPSQFLIEDWAAVGVRVVLRLQARTLFQAQYDSHNHDLTVWIGAGEFTPHISLRNFAPTETGSWYAPGYGQWYIRGGLYGSEEVKTRPGAIEPPCDHPLLRAMHVMDETRAAGTLDEQVEIFREALDIAEENLWHINISTPPPQPVIVAMGLRNVPRHAIAGWIHASPANAGTELFYFEDPRESPGVIAHIRRSITEVLSDSDDPAVASITASGRNVFGSFLRFVIIGIFLLLGVMVVVRHPFIARRLVILIPTVFVISVVVFTIIQLPPGDYVTTRIAQLEMEGDEAAIQQMHELRELFHLDESPVVRYVRWIGLPWFLSFDSADRGLLQGDLGRSMVDSRRVNEIVGDRILLTLLISTFTLLFTWSVAVPIGLYSAVKQYSLGDYFFTFIGFIGMCVPPMLLAIVLMYIGAAVLSLPVGGLFSAEYAMQPYWSWGKFVDLLKHIWIPVIVLGVSGTGGMIRVLRANMLDELGKPYVITARTKGVRPLKLLLKYPLRLALNPFISGIGTIFPALVSGGAIVGIVLSLPTVGPLQLSALMAQDMYLAGSMLMVLSLLTVFGTLVSDLLLMWVDPRIRMSGGSR